MVTDHKHKTVDNISTPGGDVKLHYSLTGEISPVLAPLSIDHSMGADSSYRYDWAMGLYSEDIPHLVSSLRHKRAIAVDLFIVCGDYSFSDGSPLLLGLQPAFNTESWWDRNAHLVQASVYQAAEVAKPLIPFVPGAVQVASNFIVSEKGTFWYMYRYFDRDEKCTVIQWNINPPVLSAYGPLLRGSIVLSFHGPYKDGSAIRLRLKPGLGFDPHNEEAYVRPVPPDEYIELALKPMQTPEFAAGA